MKRKAIAIQICLIWKIKWYRLRRNIPQQPELCEGLDIHSGFKRVAHLFVQRDLLLPCPRICHNRCVILHFPAGLTGTGGLVHGGVGAGGIAVDTVGVAVFEYVGLALDHGGVSYSRLVIQCWQVLVPL